MNIFGFRTSNQCFLRTELLHSASVQLKSRRETCILFGSHIYLMNAHCLTKMSLEQEYQTVFIKVMKFIINHSVHLTDIMIRIPVGAIIGHEITSTILVIRPFVTAILLMDQNGENTSIGLKAIMDGVLIILTYILRIPLVSLKMQTSKYAQDAKPHSMLFERPATQQLLQTWSVVSTLKL